MGWAERLNPNSDCNTRNDRRIAEQEAKWEAKWAAKEYVETATKRSRSLIDWLYGRTA